MLCLVALCAAEALLAQTGTSADLYRLPPLDEQLSIPRQASFQFSGQTPFEAEPIDRGKRPAPNRPASENSNFDLHSYDWSSGSALANDTFEDSTFDDSTFEDSDFSNGDQSFAFPQRSSYAIPASLLWEIPLANQRETRMYGKFTDLNGDLTFETAIGAEIGLRRWTFNDNPNEGIQIGLFASAFTRFDNNWTLITTDFHIGIPLTSAWGPWQTKLAFEHTSAHLGDEYIIATGDLGESHTHDEIVVGLSRRYANDIRLYGQYAYAFRASRTIKAFRNRFDLGIEWSSPPSHAACRPFMAADLDLRSVQGYVANITLQAGWQWRTFPKGRSIRLAFEYYDGKSPYGQFYEQKEEWIAFSIMYDW